MLKVYQLYLLNRPKVNHMNLPFAAGFHFFVRKDWGRRIANPNQKVVNLNRLVMQFAIQVFFIKELKLISLLNLGIVYDQRG